MSIYPTLSCFIFFNSKKTGLSSVSRVLFLPSPILIYLNFILSFIFFPHFALHYLLFFVISSLKTLDCLFHQASRSGNPYISSSYSCVSYSCLKIHQSASYDTLSYHWKALIICHIKIGQSLPSLLYYPASSCQLLYLFSILSSETWIISRINHGQSLPDLLPYTTLSFLVPLYLLFIFWSETWIICRIRTR